MMFRVKALRFLVLACTVAVAGCSDTRPTAPVEEPIGLTLDAPRVTVTGSGSGHKQALTYHDVGAEQEVSVTAGKGFAQSVLQGSEVAAGRASEPAVENTTLPLKAKVEKASEAVEGQQPATRNAFATVDSPTNDGDKNVHSARGFQFGWRAVDSGQMSSLRLAAPREASDEARGAVEAAVLDYVSLPIIFPQEPIGQGARWEVDSRVTGESTLLQTTTFTLDKVDGDLVTLSVSVKQRPSLGALSFAGQAEGTALEDKELEVKDSSTESSGSITVDLGKPLPVAGEVSIHTTVAYGTDSSPLRVVQRTRTELAFSSPAAG